MTTNNQNLHEQEWCPPEIANVIKTLGEEYFPEFLAPCKESIHDQATSCSDEVTDKGVSDDCLTEDDYIKAISDAVNPFDEPINMNETYCKKTSGREFDVINTDTLSGLTLSPNLVPNLGTANPCFDVNTVRRDFPILSQKVNGKNLIWLDNAATTQKPKAVIGRLKYFYEHENSNVHRGAHTLAARTTDAYEGARSKIASFLGAADSSEIVFVRGTTEAINLVAQSLGIHELCADDEIILSILEHHANIVPWQMVCAKTGAKLKVIPVQENGQIMLSEFKKLLSNKTKIVAFTHVSNALGTITPVAEMIDMAHQYGAKVLVDGAQAAAHIKVDVQALDCDFYALSGHKIFGPTGIGVLYGKRELLEAMPPYQGGGSMISDVTFEHTEYKSPPHKFEAGTGNIADAIALGTAIDYVSAIGLDAVFEYEHKLLEYATQRFQSINGFSLIGNAAQKTSIISFTLSGYTPEEVGKGLDREGIAVRAGHHCAQPILRRFGQESTVRISLAFYNTREEIDAATCVVRRLASHQTSW